MDWTKGLAAATEYIENHLTGEIDCDAAARAAYSSKFHFQRVFGIACGITPGRYIRERRLTLAGSDLMRGENVLDVALKYGYGTPESFARAFEKFHGVMPSAVKKGSRLKSRSRITTDKFFSGEKRTECEIARLGERVFVGYKRRFAGVPCGAERARQEEDFFRSTRAKQWLLLGAARDNSADYCVVTNIDDEGYDFYIAYDLDEPTREDLYDRSVTGVDFMESLGLETIVLPAATYAVFRTARQRRPVGEYADMRSRAVVEWLSSSDYVLAEGAEVVVMKWRDGENGDRKNNKYIEVQLPVTPL